MSVWYNDNLNIVSIVGDGLMYYMFGETPVTTMCIGPLESWGWVYIGELE